MYQQKPHCRVCPDCGCSLDAGEVCECKRRAEKQLVTYADWEAAGDFNKAAHPGDLVTEDIVEEMCNSVPPTSLKPGYMQVGEAYNHEYDPATGHWRPTFGTFLKRGEHWTYCGHCFAGKTTEPEKPIRKEN